MAVSQISTYGLLDSWRRIMNVSIWHFNQVLGVNSPQSTLSDAYIQDEREAVAMGLDSALTLITGELNFPPLPIFCHERIYFRNLHPPRLHEIQLKNRYVQAIGRRASTLLQSAASVTYTDTNSAGVDDTATITVTVPAGTVASEIQAFFQSSDWSDVVVFNGETADERWQIAPLKVSVSGVTATLTGNRALFVKPAIWAKPFNAPNYNSTNKNRANPATAADFVTAVNVYRIYADVTSAVQIVDTYNNVATNATAAIESGDEGLISINDGTINYADALDIYYVAGYPLKNGFPEPALERAIIRLANCNMPSQSNDNSDPRTTIFQSDSLVELVNGQPVGDSPFGKKGGQLAAWAVIEQYAYPFEMGRT